VLQQFGIITGMTIIYAFLGSVIVLPSLLVLWTRHFGPAEKLEIEASDDRDDDGSAAAGDPGPGDSAAGAASELASRTADTDGGTTEEFPEDWEGADK